MKFEGVPASGSNEITASEAEMYVRALLHQAYITGAVDSESESFESILANMREGKLAPADAVAQAEGIISSRQDYH